VVAITPTLRDVLVMRLGLSACRAMVIRNSVDVSAFELRRLADREGLIGVECQKQIVGFIGRLAEEKGIMKFIRIAALLDESDFANRLHFVVVGDGPLKTEVMAAVDRLGLSQKLSLLGARSDIPEILGCLDVLLAPSRFEGLPIIGLEAMAAGTAIVASRVVGWNMLLDHERTGILVDRYDEVAFARAVESLLDHPEQREAITAEARRHVREHYSREQFNEAYTTLFGSLLAAGVSAESNISL